MSLSTSLCDGLNRDYANQCIEDLAFQIKELQSFNYSTLKEAQKTVISQKYFYTFDALSMCSYEHNLSPTDFIYLGKALDVLCNGESGEWKKERYERAVLFHYLRMKDNPFCGYKITKQKRPDFVLEGNLYVGVEVTKLTDETDEVLNRIIDSSAGTTFTPEQIKQAAIEKHGRKARDYSYMNIGDSVGIGIPVFNIDDRKKHFAEHLSEKYRKYMRDYSRFDRFYILADGQHGIEFTSKRDVDDVYRIAVQNTPEITKMTVAILWMNGNKTDVSQYPES